MIGEKFNSKVVELMDKHPKASKRIISGVIAASTMMPTIQAFAEEVTGDTQNISTTAASALASSASDAYSAAAVNAVPVLGTGVGFNVAVRMIRRFVKG